MVDMDDERRKGTIYDMALGSGQTTDSFYVFLLYIYISKIIINSKMIKLSILKNKLF
jgi:hypothetical protein